MALAANTQAVLRIALAVPPAADDMVTVINGAPQVGSANTFTAANTFSGAVTATGGVTISTTALTITDVNIVLSATTGTQLGTAGTQKLGFYGATPIVQPANTVDYVTMLTNLGLRATGGTAAASFPGAVTSSSATAGIGYATGAGGAVTQATNRTTGVTLNTLCGAITTNNASLAAGATAKFTVTNSAVAATDTVELAIKSSTTTDQTDVKVQGTAAGSFDIVVANRHASTAETGAIVINFAVLKSVTA